MYLSDSLPCRHLNFQLSLHLQVKNWFSFGRGDDQVVSVLALFSDDHSLNLGDYCVLHHENKPKGALNCKLKSQRLHVPLKFLLTNLGYLTLRRIDQTVCSPLI